MPSFISGFWFNWYRLNENHSSVSEQLTVQLGWITLINNKKHCSYSFLTQNSEVLCWHDLWQFLLEASLALSSRKPAVPAANHPPLPSDYLHCHCSLCFPQRASKSLPFFDLHHGMLNRACWSTNLHFFIQLPGKLSTSDRLSSTTSGLKQAQNVWMDGRKDGEADEARIVGLSSSLHHISRVILAYPYKHFVKPSWILRAYISC